MAGKAKFGWLRVLKKSDLSCTLEPSFGQLSRIVLAEREVDIGLAGPRKYAVGGVAKTRGNTVVTDHCRGRKHALLM